MRRFEKSHFCGRWSQSRGHQAHANGATNSKISKIVTTAFVPDVRIPTSNFSIFQRVLCMCETSYNYMLTQFCTHSDLQNLKFGQDLARASLFCLGQMFKFERKCAEFKWSQILTKMSFACVKPIKMT